MFVYVICTTCQMPLGDTSEVFRRILRRRLAKLYGASGKPEPEFAIVQTGRVRSHMKDVLDALNVTLCCRGHLVACVDIRDVF